MSDMEQKATTEEIEKRAYQLFEERGCRHGGALEDWIDAERELANPKCTELSKTASAGRGQSKLP
jgi:Protein of unknown function (DUF2934)